MSKLEPVENQVNIMSSPIAGGLQLQRELEPSPSCFDSNNAFGVEPRDMALAYKELEVVCESIHGALGRLPDGSLNTWLRIMDPLASVSHQLKLED